MKCVERDISKSPAVTTITIFNHFYNRPARSISIKLFSEPSNFLLNLT